MCLGDFKNQCCPNKAYHLLPRPICPHLYSNLVNDTFTHPIKARETSQTLHSVGPLTCTSGRSCQLQYVLRHSGFHHWPSRSLRSPHTALQPGELGQLVTSAWPQQAVTTDVLLSSSTAQSSVSAEYVSCTQAVLLDTGLLNGVSLKL